MSREITVLIIIGPIQVLCCGWPQMHFHQSCSSLATMFSILLLYYFHWSKLYSVKMDQFSHSSWIVPHIFVHRAPFHWISRIWKWHTREDFSKKALHMHCTHNLIFRREFFCVFHSWIWYWMVPDILHTNISFLYGRNSAFLAYPFEQNVYRIYRTHTLFFLHAPSLCVIQCTTSNGILYRKCHTYVPSRWCG